MQILVPRSHFQIKLAFIVKSKNSSYFGLTPHAFLFTRISWNNMWFFMNHIFSFKNMSKFSKMLLFVNIFKIFKKCQKISSICRFLKFSKNAPIHTLNWMFFHFDPKWKNLVRKRRVSFKRFVKKSYRLLFLFCTYFLHNC